MTLYSKNSIFESKYTVVYLLCHAGSI